MELFSKTVNGFFTKTFHHRCLTVPYHGYFLPAMFSFVSLSFKVYIYNGR